MPVNYKLATKSDRMVATKDHFSDGTLEILTTEDLVLVVFDITIAGGTVTDDIWTIGIVENNVPASAGGIAAKAQIKNSLGTANLTGLTVAEADADILVDNVNINSGQAVQLNSSSIQHAA